MIDNSRSVKAVGSFGIELADSETGTGNVTNHPIRHRISDGQAVAAAELMAGETGFRDPRTRLEPVPAERRNPPRPSIDGEALPAARR